MPTSTVSFKNNLYIPQSVNSTKFSIVSGVKAAAVGSLLLCQYVQAQGIRGSLPTNFNLTQLNSTEFQGIVFDLAVIIGKGLAKGKLEGIKDYTDSQKTGCTARSLNGTCLN